MGRIHLVRAQAELRAGQERLRADRLAMERERLMAVVALRELCERYGDNSWTDETALATIIEVHLGRPLARLAADRRPEAMAYESRGDRLAPAPAPLRPTVVPTITHRCLIVDADDRGVPGKRATCTCGWRSAVERDERSAILAGERHRDRFAPATLAAR
jgi:hypothetical protein